MKKTFGVLLVFTTGALAQGVHVGLKGGVPLTEAFETVSEASRGYFSKTRRYIVGPSFELGLPAGFGIELDMLYTRLQFNSIQTLPGPVSTSDTSASSFEFPLLLKKKFGEGDARPFVSTGAAFRRLTDITQITDFVTGSRSTDDPPELRDRNSVGFVIGGGVELRVLLLKITPEVRFVRWGTENFREGISGLLKTNRSQGQFLVGLSF
jgi:hypothetical protein